MSTSSVVGTGPYGSDEIVQSLGTPRPFGSADSPQPSPAAQLEAEKTLGPTSAGRLKTAATLFPSSRQRTQGEIINLTLALERLGNPFSVRRLPFSILRDMLTDPMIGFAYYYTKIPLMRADWRINCQDPQIAAAVDEALRPINPRIQNQLCGRLGYGYQPMCKNFKLGPLTTTYRDHTKADPDQDIPTWTSNLPALLWKDATVLAPEHCMPRWNDKGEFDGFTYSLVPYPNPVQVGITELYGYQSLPGYTIPAEFAVWAINEQDESFGCQPPDAPVLTVNRGYVPIGDLDPETDRLASYGGYGEGRCGKIHRGARRRNNGKNGYEFEKAERPYVGDLLTFTTSSGRIIQTTPNHKFTVRWNREAENRWAVYLMRRGEDWRIGMTRLHRDGGRANSGIGNRLQGEGADAAWVLGVFNSKREALLAEALLSHRFHIPDLTFKVAGPRSDTAMSQDDLDHFWSSVNSEDDARELLESLQLDEKFPLYTRSVNRENLTQAGWRNKWTIQACNMPVLQGLLDLPIDGGGMYPEWEPYTFSRSHYEGTVVSLEVLPHHHYISGDIITQNSIYGSPRTKRAYRYWWSYWYRWALADRIFESSADPVKIVYYPTDTTEGIDPNNPNDDGTTPTALSLQARALAVGDSARQGATLAFPGDLIREEGSNQTSRMRKWSIEYLENKADFSALDATFTHLDALKFRAMMLPEEAFVQPGQGQRSARNVATQLGELYQQSTVILAQENDDYINKHWIPQFIEANFPDRVGITCTKDSTGFGLQDEETFRQILTIIGQVKGEILPVDIRELLRLNGYPLLSEQQQKANEEQIAKEAQAMQPPLGNPEKIGMQGYNSGIGQTPQGSRFYYRGPERIDLDAFHHGVSNSFLGTLPDIPAYKDPAVRSSMIKLRKLMLERYESHIASFVKHLRERPTLALADQATNQQQDGQQQKTKIHAAPAAGIAATLVATWLTGEAVQETVKTIEDLLYGIALHAGTRTVKAAMLDKSVVDPFMLQSWATRRAQFVVDSVDNTLKSEFTTFLTDQLQRNPDPAAAARAAEARFDSTATSHADRVVLAEALPAYNFGQLTALYLAGVAQVQAHDASDGRDETTDVACKRRDGEIMSVPDALREAEDEHPAGTLYFTALSTDDLRVLLVDEMPDSVQDGLRASYDSDREQLLILSDTTEEEQREFALAVGGALALA